MKLHLITLITFFTISNCYSQKITEKNAQVIYGDWEFEQFEDVVGRNVKKSGELEIKTFIFNKNDTLEVIYFNGKQENYIWSIKKETLEIKKIDLNVYNKKIVGKFEISHSDLRKLAFLQRKNRPHYGIMLKK